MSASAHGKTRRRNRSFQVRSSTAVGIGIGIAIAIAIGFYGLILAIAIETATPRLRCGKRISDLIRAALACFESVTVCFTACNDGMGGSRPWPPQQGF